MNQDRKDRLAQLLDDLTMVWAGVDEELEAESNLQPMVATSLPDHGEDMQDTLELLSAAVSALRDAGETIAEIVGVTDGFWARQE